ncbi:MAG: YafY family transcriptional regulator [Nocardioides sp.]|nr:YafY family transcriptional regulator [Nocardioides sp.]
MSTSARMLQLLDLLQTHRFWPGAELAGRLEVSERTVRRDVERLRDLGYEVAATRGAAGGYQLQAGNALPPLLLDDEEAVAIAVGLRTAASGGAAGTLADVSVRALSKVVALMPAKLRRRIDAVDSQTDTLPWGGPVPLDVATLGVLAQACRDAETVTFAYVAREGAESERLVEPHRLVMLANRWYLLAHDQRRHDWRSFRVDRVTAVATTGRRFRPREVPGGDAAAYVRAGIKGRPQRYEIRVRFAAPVDVVTAAVGRWAIVEADGDGARMILPADDLTWGLLALGRVDADYVVEGPDELAELVARVAGRLHGSGARRAD